MRFTLQVAPARCCDPESRARAGDVHHSLRSPATPRSTRAQLKDIQDGSTRGWDDSLVGEQILPFGIHVATRDTLISSLPTELTLQESTCKRMKAFILLLRYSGLRRTDAVGLSAERVKNGRVFLYTQKQGHRFGCRCRPSSWTRWRK